MLANICDYLCCQQLIYTFPNVTFNSKTLSVNVKILITRFEGKCKYFSSIKLDSVTVSAGYGNFFNIAGLYQIQKEKLDKQIL